MSDIEDFPHDEEQIEEPITPQQEDAKPQKPENITNEQLPQEIKSEKAQIEERVSIAFEKQDGEISRQESKHDKKTLSGFRKWIGIATVMGASLLTIGCNAEKSSDGFTDNEHNNVQQRLKLKQAEIKHMKEMKGYRPSKEVRDFRREMNEGKIVQPIDGESGFTDEGSVRGPSKEVKPGPSGKVSNPEDL